jgi:alkyl hydroperoxide reductase subunit D
MTANTTALGDRLPEAAKDIRLNLGAVLQPGTLTAPQTWGVALSAAFATRAWDFTGEVLAAARAAGIGEPVIEDAKAAAALMAMNNIYYRFQHLVGAPEYEGKPPRLRMNRLARPATDKPTFELFALAVSVINGCEMCIQAHEHAIRAGGLTPDHVHDAVRIAAVINAAATAAQFPNP